MEFDFETNTTVASDDFEATVPEKYRGLYVESESGYVVSDAAKGLVGDYVGTQKSLAGLRIDKKKVTDENAQRRVSSKTVEDFAASIGLDVGDDGVAAALKLFIEDLQGQVKGGKELKINLDKINQDWERRMSELDGSKNNEIAERDAALHNHLISDRATRALAEHKGSIDLLLPHVQGQCKVVRLDDGKYTVQVVDAQGDTRFDGSGGMMGVEGLVSEMKTQDKFTRAFEPESPAGSGARPGSMSRPVARQGDANRELTPQEKIKIGLQKGQAVDGRGGSTLGGT